MKTKEIAKMISGGLSKLGFKIKKASPEIMVIAGVTGTVVSAVMACKATLKAPDIMAEAADQKKKIEEVKTLAERGELKDGQTYTENDSYRDKAIVIRDAGLKLIKLYAPSVALGVLSLTSILASNNILKKRNAALAAAYATVDQSLKKYRKRVVERFGERVDWELRHGVKALNVEEKGVDENGKEKTVNKTVDVIGRDDSTGYNDYSRVFDVTNPNYDGNNEYNMMFLRAQQQYANDLLHTRGYLYLNEVYNMLGFEWSKAGQVVGWVYSDDNSVGDNYVDFGIHDARLAVDESSDEYEDVIMLDFNVDGNILDLMK